MKIYYFQTSKVTESIAGKHRAYHVSCSQLNLLITNQKRVKSDQNYHGSASYKVKVTMSIETNTEMQASKLQKNRFAAVTRKHQIIKSFMSFWTYENSIIVIREDPFLNIQYFFSCTCLTPTTELIKVKIA